MVYLDFKANVDKLLEKDGGSLSINHRNLAIEILKFLNGLSPPIMTKVFQIKPPAPYTLRGKNELYCRNPKTVTYGTESIPFLASKIWSMVNSTSRNKKSVNI